MKFKEKISIEDFDGVRYKIRLIEGCDNRQASFTHYLYNNRNGVARKFKEDAKNFVKEILSRKYPNDSISDSNVDNALKQLIINFNYDTPFPPPSNPKFKFIDLFAGIGGFRIALQNIGGKCVFTSEWDKYAKLTYAKNFGETPFGDIRSELTKKHIPSDFDVLCAGFPCQAFSIAGRRGGFEDTRGTLFFEVAEIIKKHRPKAIFLENVKGLISHDRGNTLATILNVLRNDLHYFIPDPKIINAKNFGVPQNRERIFIVGFRNDLNINNFLYPQQTSEKVKVKDILEKKEVSVKYYLSSQYLKTLRAHRARHESKGNGFGFEIIQDNQIANAIVVGGMGKERNLIIDTKLTNFKPVTKIKGDVNKEGIRKMTPREWARLQGFPNDFDIPVSDVQAYKQFGNSVCIPAIQATANEIIKQLEKANAINK
jgi:DNA (cytosine-5)-methyltransferase 1